MLTPTSLVVVLISVNHEVTNYLHGRFRSDSLPAICRVVAFGAGITADLAFEKAVFDPFVVGASAVFAPALLRTAPHRPVLRYHGVAYTVGLLATDPIKTA